MAIDESPRRTEQMTPEQIQYGNKEWWTSHTMSYDWNDRVSHERYSATWFDEVDARFLHGARLYTSPRAPFANLIPLDKLAGKRVLEIGCGMGFHSELMARAGADLTAIDLSPVSVEATRRRFQLKNLVADIREADAESIPFQDNSFDFIWSWGVIHHSARTARVVREIARTSRPDGEARVMVYYRGATSAKVAFFRDHILKGRFLRQEFDSTLMASSDGFSARFYTRDQFADLFRAYFNNVEVSVCGQDSDALPLPRSLRRIVLPLCSTNWLVDRQARVGSFLFLQAKEGE